MHRGTSGKQSERIPWFVMCLALGWGAMVATLGLADETPNEPGHEEHQDGGETEDHSDHDHAALDGAEEDEEGIHLTEAQRQRFGIAVRPAGPGSLRNELSLPGEVVFNEDHVVHMVPRVAGIAREVHKIVGDRVVAGDVLVVIESRELADAKSQYLAAEARHALAQKSFRREKSLRETGVSSEQDYLEAEQALAEAAIELRSAGQKLHALGLTEQAVANLDREHDEDITRYEIRSPIDGVVTEKHVVLGESLESDADIFTVVDPTTVWVNLTVYTKDLGAVHAGQEVLLQLDHSGARAQGQVTMVTPFLEESTRSATARIVLDNSDGRWMPGTFVTGFISSSVKNLPVVVPKEAVQSIEGRHVVFVEHDDRFEMAPVVLGQSDRTSVEITSGLQPGSHYVVEGAFQLKATVVTSDLGSHAGHGH